MSSSSLSSSSAAAAASSAEYDAIVIGAGISGLTAAYELLKLNPNYRLLLLEAKDRVGGRTLMQSLRVAHNEEALFDLGGMWVGPTQRHIASLLEELDIQLYPQYLQGKKIAEMGSRVSEYSGEIPYIGLMGLLDMGKSIVQLERYVRGVHVDEPALSRNAAHYDSISAQALLNSVSWSANTKHLVTAAARTIWGAELNRMSALYMLTYAKSAGSMQSLIASDQSSGQGFRMKGGAQAVSLRLAERVGQQRLRLNSPVAAIDQENCEHVTVTLAAGESQDQQQRFTSRAVICAVPPHLLASMKLSPPLPVSKLEFCKASQVGHLFKFVITYETAFWRELGFSGEIVSAGAPPTAAACSCAPISVCFDYSVNDDRHPALVVLSGGQQAHELDSLSSQQRRSAVLGHLARFFPKEKVEACVDFAEKNWRQEAYNGGCPVDIVSTGGASLMGSNSRSPFNRIFFAGTELATDWCGFMDGAVQSGVRAASELHLRLSAVPDPGIS